MGSMVVESLLLELSLLARKEPDLFSHLPKRKHHHHMMVQGTNLVRFFLSLIPPVRKLVSREPSPFLAYHLGDIIYSYCFTQRLYNGDWQSDAIGSETVVLSVSSVLGQAGQPETVLEALSYCLERTCSPEYRHMGRLQFGLGLVDDVIHVMSPGGHALICLLSDLQKMVQAGEKELKAEETRKSESEIRSKLKLAERKVYFIMCWVHEQPGEAWSSLAAIVRAEKSSGMDYRGGKNLPAAKK